MTDHYAQTWETVGGRLGDERLEMYIKSMSRKREYGDGIMLEMFAQKYGRPVHLHYFVSGNSEPVHLGYTYSGFSKVRTERNHYVSLAKESTSTPLHEQESPQFGTSATPDLFAGKCCNKGCLGLAAHVTA